MTVRISEAAAKFIMGFRELRPSAMELIPVIVWINGDTHPESLVPRLGVGFEEEKLLPGDRFVSCATADIRICQYIPDEILAQHPDPFVDVNDNELVFSSEKPK